MSWRRRAVRVEPLETSSLGFDLELDRWMLGCCLLACWPAAVGVGLLLGLAGPIFCLILKPRPGPNNC